jgi:DNA-binding response OmpR family regulator
VIFLTTKAEADDEKQGFEVGAADYIHKPFSAPIVLARVKTHTVKPSRMTPKETFVGAVGMSGMCQQRK